MAMDGRGGFGSGLSLRMCLIDKRSKVSDGDKRVGLGGGYAHCYSWGSSHSVDDER
jgi:hypothetical protein